MRITSLIVSFFLLAVVPAHGIAQDTTGQAIETIPQNSPAQQIPPASDIPPHTNLVDRFLKDHGHIWTSPLHIKRGDVKWLLPLGAGAAALLATDQKAGVDVLNGIAAIPGTDEFLVTGKLWPVMFRVKFVSTH